jgi:dihydrofolate reductase
MLKNAMATRKLVYSTSLSLDGYIDSESGDPSWVAPDEELHKHFNDVEREVDTLLYGRRMYELMASYWPTADEDPSAPAVIVEYAQLWKPVAKVVFSSTLERVDWNSRLVRGDAVAEVGRLKAQPGGTMGVGGVHLASALAAAGLIDEYRLYYVPILLGSGKAAFSQIQRSVQLKLIETRTFTSGTVLLRRAPVRG